jgi:apolipoprotein N-acyltransferase
MIIDPWGRVSERLALNTRGTITHQVFYNVTPPFYVRHGDIFIWILSSIGVLGLIWSLFRK